MDLLRQILLILHIFGLAALIGGLLVQTPEPVKKVNAAMRDGIGGAFVTGLLLVGVLEAGDGTVNHAKIGVKLLIALVILVLVMANVRKEQIPKGLWMGLVFLSLANVCVAVLWSSAHAS